MGEDGCEEERGLVSNQGYVKSWLSGGRSLGGFSAGLPIPRQPGGYSSARGPWVGGNASTSSLLYLLFFSFTPLPPEYIVKFNSPFSIFIIVMACEDRGVGREGWVGFYLDFIFFLSSSDFCCRHP